MGTTLATYYAKLQDMPDSEYKVEILEDGLSIQSSSTIIHMEYRFLLLPIIHIL